MIDLLALRIYWHTISFAILENSGNLIEFEAYSVEDLYTSLLCDLDLDWEDRVMESVVWIRNLWVDTYAVELPDGKCHYPCQGF